MKRILFLSLSLICGAETLFGQQLTPLFNFTCSMLDDAGTLWLGTSGGGLWQLDGGSLTPYTLPELEDTHEFYSMTLDRQGNLWVGGTDAVYMYDYINWKRVTDSSTLQANGRIVRGISVNHYGHALMGVEDRLNQQELIMRFNGKSTVDLIKPFDAFAVYEDLEANIWMAHGAYRMEDGKLVSKISLPTGTIRCAIQDSRGEVWLGIDGKGIYRYDGISFRFYGDDHGFENCRVTCLYEDKHGRIWMATESTDGLVKKGIAYVESGSFHHLHDSPECPVRGVNTIASDKRGNVWFAGDGGELVRFNGRKFSVINVPEVTGK